MELKHLRCFVAVGEHLHFGRAAESLRMAQPALSAQIKALEQEVGTQLFFRTTRKVSLTATGRVFLDEARSTLERADLALFRVRQADGDHIEWLRIGGVDSATAGLLPPVIREFRGRVPDADLRVSELLTARAIDELANHRLDLAFVRLPSRDPLLKSRRLLREPCVVIVPAEHHLARKRFVTRAELANEPLVLPPRAARPIHHDMLKDWFRDGGFTPMIAQEADERHMIVAIVASGLGVSILPAWVAQFRHPDVVFKQIKGEPPVVEVHMVRRASCRSRLAGIFAGIVDEHLSKRRRGGD